MPRNPLLETLSEYWPGHPNAKHWNNVRLPGGRYVRPGIKTWCQLISIIDGETSRDGHGAARLLLVHQIPASVVPSPDKETIHWLDDPAVSECQDMPFSDESSCAHSIQGPDS